MVKKKSKCAARDPQKKAVRQSRDTQDANLLYNVHTVRKSVLSPRLQARFDEVVRPPSAHHPIRLDASSSFCTVLTFFNVNDIGLVCTLQV